MNKGYYGVRRVGDHDEPHIAHAGREKGWKMPNAKYIARLITSNGTYKYIYNQAQLAAAKGGQAMSRVRRTAQNAAGELRKRSGAFRQVDNALGMSRSGAQVKKARATRAKVYGTQNGLQKALKNAGSAVSKAAGKAGKALSDASGLTARKELKKAARTAERVSKGISSKRGPYESYNPNDPLEKRRNSTKKRYQDKAVKARDKYNKTLLGRAESAGRSIGDIAEYVGNAAGKAVNSYKAQQNSKRIAKKVSKKNAEFKKQQLEKIQKAKNNAGRFVVAADVRARTTRKAYNHTKRQFGENDKDTQRIKREYQSEMLNAKAWRGQRRTGKVSPAITREEERIQKAIKAERKPKLPTTGAFPPRKNPNTPENRIARLKGHNTYDKIPYAKNRFTGRGTKPITYKSKKAKKELREAFIKDLNTPMREAKRPDVTKRTPLHLAEGDRYGLKRPERARWGMSRADWVKYDIKNYTTQNKRKRKGPVVSRRTRDARYSSR